MTKYIGMREYTTLMLCITVFFLFADQNLLAPNLSAIAKDFGFSDRERDEKLGGYIAIGFFIVGGVVALLVGYFTDTVNRIFLFGFIVIFGESAGFSTFFVKNYSELFFCRVLTGISIGGANPVIFSILGDLYSGNSRIYVSTMIGISQSAGVAFGQFLAGMVGSSMGWRAPFIMIALPAMFCGFVVFFTVKEPSRGAQEKAVRMLRETKTVNTEVIYGSCEKSNEKHGNNSFSNNIDQSPSVSAKDSRSGVDITYSNEYEISEKKQEDELNYSEKIECAKLARLFQTTSAVLIFIQGFPGCLPWGMIFVFLNDYLSEDRGMSVQSATGVLTCFGVGGLFGQLFGGWLGQRLYNIDVRYQCILMGTSTLVAVIPILYLINGENEESISIFFVALIGGFIVNINGPNVRVVLQNICIPEIRGTAFAIFSLADDIGKGLGPALVVVLIVACNGNRQEAFNIVVLFWIFCGVLLLMLTFTVKQDEEIVHETVKQSVIRKMNLPPSLPNHFETIESMNTIAQGINPIYSGADYSETSYVKICEDEHRTSIIIDRTSSNDYLLPSNRNLIHKSENKITIKHNHSKVSSTVSTTYDTENPIFTRQHTSTNYHDVPAEVVTQAHAYQNNEPIVARPIQSHPDEK